MAQLRATINFRALKTNQGYDTEECIPYGFNNIAGYEHIRVNCDTRIIKMPDGRYLVPVNTWHTRWIVLDRRPKYACGGRCFYDTEE